jgi:hypothetical protein
MPIRRSNLLLLSAGVLCTSVALAQDNEAMRKQLRSLGVPEAEIDRMLKGLDDKLKESGASEAERGAIMSQRKRGVKVHARWSMEVKRHEAEIVYGIVAVNRAPRGQDVQGRQRRHGPAPVAPRPRQC